MTTITGGKFPLCYGTNYCNIKSTFPIQCLAIVNVANDIVGHNVNIYRPGDVEKALTILEEICRWKEEEIIDIFCGAFHPCYLQPFPQKRLPNRHSLEDF